MCLNILPSKNSFTIYCNPCNIFTSKEWWMLKMVTFCSLLTTTQTVFFTWHTVTNTNSMAGLTSFRSVPQNTISPFIITI